jgi:hypothetical protein
MAMSLKNYFSLARKEAQKQLRNIFNTLREMKINLEFYTMQTSIKSKHEVIIF